MTFPEIDPDEWIETAREPQDGYQLRELSPTIARRDAAVPERGGSDAGTCAPSKSRLRVLAFSRQHSLSKGELMREPP